MIAILLSCACTPKAEGPAPSQPGTLSQPEEIRSAEGLYQFTLPSGWREKPNPGEKIEKMYVAPANQAGFFVLRIANPPDPDIKEPQLESYVEGLGVRYRHLQVLSQKILEKYGRSIGIVEFAYDEATPKGTISIHNYCEVIIHQGNYFNVCGVAPEMVWKGKQSEIQAIFSSWKLL